MQAHCNGRARGIITNAARPGWWPHLRRTRPNRLCARASLLRDFKSHKELYNHKIQQQGSLSETLRKKQKALKEHEGANMRQV